MLIQVTALLNLLESSTRFVSTVKDHKSKAELLVERDSLRLQLEQLEAKLKQKELEIEKLRQEIQEAGSRRRKRK